MNLVGMKFNRLIVIEPFYKNGRKSWKCICECGNETIVRTDSLKSNDIKSCGCLHKEIVSSIGLGNYKHGNSKNGNVTKEYNVWRNMKARCYDKENNRYYCYGARGITICDRWLNSFENFLKDVGKAPSPNHSIDRIDNNGNYEPSNCRWATSLEQIHNRSI